ncbi:hypothetical protein PHYBLDRAFT_142648 [Phycomyces blakesleeanus NRRL 1555(-)]|uniref:Uncharacterized protein n=1 Tax=Phycomyces blakesleeanus (strain ATCC 8743b / DSM 1359 / FGSC 10004 / NBRC 33097 / NRRL 1555) TaxID=763407 RepID=A0A162XXL3_PHYB8|nr:hypothetical protein PHYBLDRAFT_142648 [Phycomyces blakesleeanus NRRL 1555(-)]OAD77135.1 hypothetical protein PHYBLDRAFT_142648 [Phycomyces blakesleeanus NRRL 1555(-)]|eukprot:XP_018295175.1 hypothetical protein PHYBLDRAFT_142648 [Phycomyces blakesleeanus NRRL 1555(-)]
MAKNDDQIYIHYGRPNSKDQNSNLGYSVFTIRLHNEKIVFLPVRQSKPAIMDPISVQCYSVLAVKGNEQEPVPLLSMPMIPNPSPIQSDRATIKDPISIHVFTAQVEEQGFHLHPRLQIILVFTQSKPNYKASVARPGSPSKPTSNALSYIQGMRYTCLV